LHPAGGARRADAAALAAERDQQFVAASRATHAGEAVGEDAAAQVALELGDHEARQGTAVLLEPRQEGLEVLPHGRVQDRLLRLAPAI